MPIEKLMKNPFQPLILSGIPFFQHPGATLGTIHGVLRNEMYIQLGVTSVWARYETSEQSGAQAFQQRILSTSNYHWTTEETIQDLAWCGSKMDSEKVERLSGFT